MTPLSPNVKVPPNKVVQPFGEKDNVKHVLNHHRRITTSKLLFENKDGTCDNPIKNGSEVAKYLRNLFTNSTEKRLFRLNVTANFAERY